MESTLPTLLTTALTVGFVHTLIGVDHYLPFVALSTAEGWSVRKTLGWTLACGIGHVGATVLLGGLFAVLGWAIGGLSVIETIRADLAAYLLIGFGVAIALGETFRQGSRHCHLHVHKDGTIHAHPHSHDHQQQHQHEGLRHHFGHQRTIWLLFIIFVLGPCESLIPLMLASSVQHHLWGSAAILIAFSAATLLTMCAMVLAGLYGINLLKQRRSRFCLPAEFRLPARALAGVAVACSGVLILVGL